MTDPALEVWRTSIGQNRLVYLLLADKRLKYLHGRSHVAYIGTTKKGVARIAASAAYRAEEILGMHGVRRCTARVVTVKRRQNVKTWVKLESALLLVFRREYGHVPICNTAGKRRRETDELRFFDRDRLVGILKDLVE
ncbi:MAG: hypothetical protein HYY17_00820 [Planctomycetes bacterium]|nr:hypothetical protein [Planctomycetota bacterium]